MPRYARQEAPGLLHHVISRFVNEAWRFASPVERAEYLRRVERVVRDHFFSPLAYCLMSNHLHWALRLLGGTSKDFVHPLHSGFAPWLNRFQDKRGPVFAERHKSLVFPPEDNAKLVAYIHNNP